VDNQTWWALIPPLECWYRICTAHQPDYYAGVWDAMFMNGEDGMPYDRMLLRRALLRSGAWCTGSWPVL
jgi:hypothetical protein